MGSSPLWADRDISKDEEVLALPEQPRTQGLKDVVPVREVH